jgi:hypothetical protein
MRARVVVLQRGTDHAATVDNAVDRFDVDAATISALRGAGGVPQSRDAHSARLATQSA